MRVPTRFTDLVGCRYPLQQAGIGGMTDPAVAVAVARAGGLGMLSGVVAPAMLAEHLDSVVSDAATIGVNFLVPFLDPATVDDVAGRVRVVEFFWGEPDADLVARAHAGSALVSWQIGSAREASEAQAAGCDFVVAQGIEAGGHVRGTTGLLPLLSEVSAEVDLPVVAAGGIGTGRAMAAALVGGADAVRVGTRFVAAEESVAHPAYVDALLAAGADDTVLTTAFGMGWPDAPHRVLRSALAAGEALGDAQMWTPDWPASSFTGPVEARALYAGQSVGAVTGRQPAGAIVEELVGEALALLAG